MLFGRKTPPAGAPKGHGADAAPSPMTGPAATEPAVAEPATAARSPLSSLTPPPPAAPVAPPAPAPAAAAMRSPAQPSEPSFNKGPLMNTSTPKLPTGSSMGVAPAAGSAIPRRTVDLPGVAPRRPEGLGVPAAPAPAAAPAPVAPPAPMATEQRRLIVGREISLTGEIGSCDVLVVEGTVQAKLRDGRSIEIAESGLFKGSVEIDEADIGGRFEGDITVRGRLNVRSTGRITGSIKYGELSVEAGGQLSGDIGMVGASKPAAAATPVETPVPVLETAESA